MRCKCCDAKNTKLWMGEYYCSTCLSSIKETIAEDYDDDTSRIWRNQKQDDLPLLHKGWDDG